MKIELETSQEILDQIWRELSRASKDRHHEWRTPVFATITNEDQVNARTVVLRAVDIKAHEFTLFTDARSSKVLECERHPDAMFVFWSKKLNWQIRIRVQVNILTQGEQVESLWNQLKSSRAAQDYTSLYSPGTLILQPNSSDSDHASNLSYFAILKAKVVEIDWLELSSKGHRRAIIKNNNWAWIQP
jgi:hypothetical protein